MACGDTSACHECTILALALRASPYVLVAAVMADAVDRSNAVLPSLSAVRIVTSVAYVVDQAAEA